MVTFGTRSRRGGSLLGFLSAWITDYLRSLAHIVASTICWSIRPSSIIGVRDLTMPQPSHFPSRILTPSMRCTSLNIEPSICSVRASRVEHPLHLLTVVRLALLAVPGPTKPASQPANQPASQPAARKSSTGRARCFVERMAGARAIAYRSLLP